MLGYELAKTLHFVGIIGMFLSAGFAFGFTADENRRLKRLAGIMQPVFGLLILFSAISLVSAMGLQKDFPLWGKIKFACWILMAVLGKMAIKRRSSPIAPWLFGTVFTLGCIASYIAVIKPS